MSDDSLRLPPRVPPVCELPRIVEVKRTLLGREKRFECGVLRRAGTHIVVLYVSPVAMHVHGVDLAPGTVTFGHFWTDRPYNVYHWLDPQHGKMNGEMNGQTIGHYLNLSADTRILDQPEPLLEWLDLVVDVLVMPGGHVTVLDEDEIPAGADDETRARIGAARARALADVPALVHELDQYRAALWPAAIESGAIVAPAPDPGGEARVR